VRSGHFFAYRRLFYDKVVNE